MRKYYSMEINTETETMLKRAEKFKMWLQENGYKFETSGCFDCVHFEVLLSEDEAYYVNIKLDAIVYFDKI